jgi:hypothetical protein
MRLIFKTVVGIVTGLMYGVLIGGSLLLISFLAGGFDAGQAIF